jgi:hypothetical protein
MMDTTMVRATGLRPQSAIDEEANAVMNLIASPRIQTGQFFDGLRHRGRRLRPTTSVRMRSSSSCACSHGLPASSAVQGGK